MLTYPKSTMRVRRMPMYLSSGHVTDAGEILSLFLPLPPNFPQSDLGRGADSRWALPQISSYFFFPFSCREAALPLSLSFSCIHPWPTLAVMAT